MKLEHVLTTAIKMEEEGRDFYRQAEARVKDHMGKKMFASLANDEVRHKRLLEALMSKVTPDAKDLDIPLPKERLKSVFADAKGQMEKGIPPTADDIKALEFAMGKETESYDMYKNAANDSSEPKVKAVFERMAMEENQHYEILEQTKYYLEQFANWTIWEEGGPIEGG